MTRTLTVSDPRTQHAAFLAHYLELGGRPDDGPEAAKRAGLAASDEDAKRSAAILLGSSRIQRMLKEEVQKRFVSATNVAFKSILDLAQNARNEATKLAASKELLEKAGIVTVSRSAVAVGVTAAEDLLAALEERKRALAAGEPDPYAEPIDAEYVEVR